MKSKKSKKLYLIVVDNFGFDKLEFDKIGVDEIPCTANAYVLRILELEYLF
jgi:hypothetical protein